MYYVTVSCTIIHFLLNINYLFDQDHELTYRNFHGNRRKDKDKHFYWLNKWYRDRGGNKSNRGGMKQSFFKFP